MHIPVADVQVYLHDQGHGPLTLFLHGNPDSADMWQSVITDLAPHYRCLAIDLPGFGRSSAPVTFDLSLNSHARFVDDLLTAVGVDAPINLVVHDFGAHYGLAWATTHPEKVRQIAVFNTNFFSDYRWHSWARVFRTPILGEVAMALTTERMLTQSLRQVAPKLAVEQIQQTYRLYTPAAKRMALRLYRARNPADFHGWEDNLLQLAARVPVYVLWGDQDPYIAPHYAERFGAQQVDHFAAYSHWLPIEAPHDVATRLHAFFSQHGSAQR